MATTAASLQVFVGADISGALKGLNTVSKSIGTFAGGFKSGLDLLGSVGLAKNGLDTIIGGAKGLGDALGTGLAMDLEDVTARLTAMLGSGDKAAAMIEDLRGKADATPYGFLELSKVAASLVPIMKSTNAPMDEMLKTVMALGSHDPAQGLEGAAYVLREFASGSLLSLRTRFELDTDPIEKLIAKGVPGLKALNTVLDQYGINMGLVEARAKTTGGRLNTFGDLIGSIRLEAGKPILAAFGLELDRTSGLITGNLGPLKDFARTIGTNIGGAMNTLGTELGTVFQTATNIAALHDVPFLKALEVAATGRIGELFGEEAMKNVIGFSGAIQGIPATLTGMKTTFDGLGKTLASVNRTFGLFIIGLADVPGFGALKDEAAQLRKSLDIPALVGPTPLERTLPFVRAAPGLGMVAALPAAGAGLGALVGGLNQFGERHLTPFLAGADHLVQQAGAWAFPALASGGDVYNNSFNLDLSGLDPRSPADADEITRRIANMWLAAQKRVANSTGPEAPGA